MKVRFQGEGYSISLLHGKIYDVIEIEPVCGWFRIIDETEEDYLYPPEYFEVVELFSLLEKTEK